MDERSARDASWAEHRRDQIRSSARETTPTQRLAWLEAALRLAHESGALQRAREARAREQGL